MNFLLIAVLIILISYHIYYRILKSKEIKEYLSIIKMSNKGSLTDNIVIKSHFTKELSDLVNNYRGMIGDTKKLKQWIVC